MNYKTNVTRLLNVATKCQNARIIKHKSLEAGPSGEDLYVNEIHMGSETAANVAAVVIGEHGIEADPGLLAMISILQRLEIPSEIKLVVVAALCSWGHAHDERTDKRNRNVARSCVANIPANHKFDSWTHIAGRKKFDEEAFWNLAVNEPDVFNQEFRPAIAGGQPLYDDAFEYANFDCEARETMDDVIGGLNQQYIRRGSFLTLHSGYPGHANRKKNILISYTSDLATQTKVTSVHGHNVQFPNITNVANDPGALAIKGSLPKYYEDNLVSEEGVISVLMEMGIGDTIPEGLYTVLRKHHLRFGGVEPTPENIRAVNEAFVQKFRVPGNRRWHKAYREAVELNLRNQFKYLAAA